MGEERDSSGSPLLCGKLFRRMVSQEVLQNQASLHRPSLTSMRLEKPNLIQTVCIDGKRMLYK